MATIEGRNDDEKMANLCNRTHKDQAVWYLNVFWPKLGAQTAELFFGYVQSFNKLDLQNHENGTALDELNAHRFLEALGEAMTVVEMRQYLRSTGALGEGRPKNFPITHFLMAKYKGDWRILVNASQGDNAEEIARAQAMLNEATAAMRNAQKAADESTAAANEVRREQEIYDNRTNELTLKSQSGGVVSQNKAKAELAQHLAADPLPLSRAKITAEAAEKRAAKALALAQQRVAELEAYLAELSAKSGSSAGSLWWIERELLEARKYMPKARGGIDK